HVFGVQQHIGAIVNTVRTNRKWKIQDGGHQTGTTYNSACGQDSNEMSTAIPMFSASGNTTKLL
ncbi:MAG TPA: hypothetical protein VIJ25_08610, partial [Methylococcales bacterium]